MKTRSFVSIVAIICVTVAGTAAIRGWQQAIVSVGVTLVAWVLGGYLWGRLRSESAPRTSGFDRLLAPISETPARPADLEVLERAFGWAAYTPEEFTHRVRPTLLGVASHRFQVTTGRALNADSPNVPEPIARWLLDTPTEATIDTDSIADIVAAIEEL